MLYITIRVFGQLFLEKMFFKVFTIYGHHNNYGHVKTTTALRTAKTLWNFGCSECNRVKETKSKVIHLKLGSNQLSISIKETV